jgi:hypothetical protein
MLRILDKRFFSLLAVAVAGVALTGCFWDSGSDSTLAVASTDLTTAASETTIAAVVNTDYEFAAVPVFGTDSTTIVSFTSATATPAFSIRSAGMAATGVTTFGSCIFTVTASTFPSSAPLALGKVLEVEPCALKVKIKGVQAGNQVASLATEFILGTLTSGSVTKTVTIDANGTVSVGGIVLGSVTLVQSTGATGGGG